MRAARANREELRGGGRAEAARLRRRSASPAAPDSAVNRWRSCRPLRRVGNGPPAGADSDAAAPASAPKFTPAASDDVSCPDSATPAASASASAPQFVPPTSPDCCPTVVAARLVPNATPAPETEIAASPERRDPVPLPRADSRAPCGARGTPPEAGWAGAGAAAPRRAPSRRAIPAAVRRLVWERDRGRCYYRDPLTGRRCNSSHLLQIDHLLPVAQGGNADPSNLRLACFAHHRLRHQGEPAPQPETPI